MKKCGKTSLFIVLLLFAGNTCFAQDTSQVKDNLKAGQEKTESKNVNEQNTKIDNSKQAGNVENNGLTQPVKQIKGARLDLSRSRGARPPDIVRPSGSRIPKGVGRPTGAIKPGRR
jgi:hypothetical protein